MYPTLLNIIITILSIFFLACSKDKSFISPKDQFGIFKNEQQVSIQGYKDHIMEPFITRDGTFLFFNNSSRNGNNMNIHYCRRLDDIKFEYIGELAGVNTGELEGVPTMDAYGNFFFTTMRSYLQDFHSIYGGKFSDNRIQNASRIDEHLTLNTLGWIIFDSEISHDGQFLYYALGRFAGENYPREANIFLASKTNHGFRRMPESNSILVAVNSDLLEYAPAISTSGLELFFTRADLTSEVPDVTIWHTSRNSLNASFESPSKIEAITGMLTEGPSISNDGTNLYYHKWDGNQFKLYMVSRTKM